GKQQITGLPEIKARGQGGLMDVVLHPDFAKNRWVYLSYSEPGEDGLGTAVGRGKLEGNQLSNWETLFRLHPKTSKRQHFGSRIVFDGKGYMYITTGDRGERERSQDLADSAGTVIRLHDDGRIPKDNPFVGKKNARPDIYSYGHRNQQGAALHPESGVLWTHEHGPQGGDELNIIRPGVNYGWPVITYGEEYGTGFTIGETHQEGMAQPIHYWVPSIAPSGMVFYTGKQFPEWQGNLFIGSLKFRLLVRLELDGDKVVGEHRLLQNRLGRIRDVRQGPDGYLYLLTDEDDGQLVRLKPLPQ
ncbi:MAG: PQQ-dependent sugar dehydrogenase, partial [Salinisphaeraceae bacterium]|nr:PQQ-dependent sugar dehydrogenase [Salinisphaeraceae bacterium]